MDSLAHQQIIKINIELEVIYFLSFQIKNSLSRDFLQGKHQPANLNVSEMSSCPLEESSKIMITQNLQSNNSLKYHEIINFKCKKVFLDHILCCVN